MYLEEELPNLTIDNYVKNQVFSTDYPNWTVTDISHENNLVPFASQTNAINPWGLTFLHGKLGQC